MQQTVREKGFTVRRGECFDLLLDRTKTTFCDTDFPDVRQLGGSGFMVGARDFPACNTRAAEIRGAAEWRLGVPAVFEE
jgi:hypothetical protein